MSRTILIFSIIVLMGACDNFSSQGEKYSKLVKKELAKDIREDSLFLDIKLGMTSKEFYTHCWNLNTKGILLDGEMNTAVMYKLKNELKHPGTINFYPDFYEDKIAKMRVKFSYDGWAPWNKNLFADSLMPDVLNLCNRWYPRGNEFITLNDSIRGKIHVKVDGNRRIIIGKVDERVILVDYTDLLIEEKLKKVELK